MSEEIVGAWLTPKQLRKRNRELKQVGKRICVKHQGAALPLDEEHFRCVDRARGWLSAECRVCYRKRKNEWRRNRYKANKRFAQRLRKEANQYYAKHTALCRVKHAAYRQQRRAQRFARVLGVAS